MFAVRRVQMLQQLRLLGDERVGGGIAELLRLDGLRAPQIVDERLTRLQPQHHPARPGHPGYGREPALDPAAAADAVRHRYRRDVRDLEHSGQLVVLGMSRSPHGRGIGRNSRNRSPSGPTLRSSGISWSKPAVVNPGMSSTAEQVLCTRVRVRSAADGIRVFSSPLGRG
ncbi:hypothetical protein GCM10018966_038560 [Streptomyces yanii]